MAVVTHRLLLDIVTRYGERGLTGEEDLALTTLAVNATPEDKLKAYAAAVIKARGVDPTLPFSPTPWGAKHAEEALKRNALAEATRHTVATLGDDIETITDFVEEVEEEEEDN
jgi:hypothetical protein